MNWVVSCTICGSSFVYESGKGLPEICSVCSEKEEGGQKRLEKKQKRREIITVSTPEIANRGILKTLGLVSREHIFGVGLVKEFNLEKFNKDIALVWVEKVNNEKDLLINSIQDETMELGGNAVIGIDITYQVLGTHNGVMMILMGAKGTAVVVN